MTDSDSKRLSPSAIELAEEETAPSGAPSPDAVLLVQTGYRPRDRLGRYEIVRKIGAGAMGVVFEAHDPELDRKLAVKVLLRGDSATRVDSSTGELRLLREARALARLSNPHVVPIYDVGLTGEGNKLTRVYIAMELVEGETLRAWLGRNRDWRAAISKLLWAGDGLAAAHVAGLVHRDFKPDNVLIDRSGRVRVMDFGLARGATSSDVGESGDISDSASLDQTMTRTGSIVGTPAYMAPEQHMGKRVDERADQYAFCIVVFEALYGTRPFSAPDAHALARRKLRGETVKVDTHDVPDTVHRVIMRGLAADPDDRWPSMQVMLRALRAAIRQRSRRWPFAVAALLLGGGAWGLWASNPPSSGRVCESGSSVWASTWGRETAREIEAAFAITEVPSAHRQFDRVQMALDRYGAGWVEAHDETCTALQEATDPAELDRRMLCLDRRREQVESVLEVLRSATLEGLVRGPELVSSLPTVEGCRDPLGLDIEQPSGGDQRRMVGRARRWVDLATARVQAGDPQRALADATAAYVVAQATQFEPAQAVAAEKLGIVHSDLSRDEYAAELYEEATLIARSSGLDQQAASAISHLVFVVGYRQQRFEAGLEWARMGRALLERGDISVDLEVRLLENQALVYSDHGQSDTGLELLESARALRHRHLSEDQVGLAMNYNNTATTLDVLGRFDDARAAHERAREIRAEVLGRDHPEYAMSLANIASSLALQGDYEAAIANGNEAMKIWDTVYGGHHLHAAETLAIIATSQIYLGNIEEGIEALERLLEIRRKTRPGAHSAMVTAYGNLGGAYMQAERWDDAEQAFQEALALHSSTRVADRSQTAWLEYNLGIIDFEQGRYDEAEATFLRALDLWIQYRGEDHHELTYPLSMLGRLALHRQNFPEALEHLERAHHLSANAPQSARSKYTTFLLARALWEGGTNEARAWQLAIEARDGLVDAPPPYAPERREVDTWIERRRERARRLGLLTPPLDGPTEVD